MTKVLSVDNSLSKRDITMKREVAEQLIANMRKPLLYSEDVQENFGYSSADVRTLFNRNQILMSNTPEAGRGVKVQYPMFDVIEIMAYAELSRLGVRPTFKGTWKDNKPFAIGIANCIHDVIKGMSGDTRPRLRAIPNSKDVEEVPPGSEPYVVVYYTKEQQGIWAEWADKAMKVFESAGDARVIVDCKALAERAGEIFLRYKNRL